MKIVTSRHTLTVPLSIPRPEDLEGGQQGPFPSPVKAASQGKSEPEQLWACPLAASLRKAALGWDVSLWLSCSGRDSEFPGHPGSPNALVLQAPSSLELLWGERAELPAATRPRPGFLTGCSREACREGRDGTWRQEGLPLSSPCCVTAGKLAQSFLRPSPLPPRENLRADLTVPTHSSLHRAPTRCQAPCEELGTCSGEIRPGHCSERLLSCSQRKEPR